MLKPQPATRLLFVFFITVLLNACQYEQDTETTDLDKIRERGILRVGTINNFTSYYIDQNGPAGLDYEIAKQFADRLGVQLEMVTAYRINELFPALSRGEVDILAAGITQNKRRTDIFHPGPAYYYVSEQVVYKKSTWRPRNLQQLIESGKPITIVEGSHHQDTLDALQKKHPELKYNIVKNIDSNELLKKISSGEISFTLTDSIELSLTQRLYPNLALAFEVSDDLPVSWFVRKDKNATLMAVMIEFFGDLQQHGTLDTLEEKYFGHIKSFDFVDTRAFIRALNSRLPKYQPLFKKHAGNFDWRLIAALSYQESHWKPNAKSPTGVRGLMMLTQPTAQSVGVTDRLDPEQSIKGGAQYLRQIVKRVPDSIIEHEKIWFALASYNVGFGHVMDARKLTKQQGADPNSWADVKDRLPLLRQKKYYSKTRYGYARGDEAKNYVENIRRYYHSIIGHMAIMPHDDNEEMKVID